MRCMHIRTTRTSKIPRAHASSCSCSDWAQVSYMGYYPTADTQAYCTVHTAMYELSIVRAPKRVIDCLLKLDLPHQTPRARDCLRTSRKHLGMGCIRDSINPTVSRLWLAVGWSLFLSCLGWHGWDEMGDVSSAAAAKGKPCRYCMYSCTPPPPPIQLPCEPPAPPVSLTLRLFTVGTALCPVPSLLTAEQRQGAAPFAFRVHLAQLLSFALP